MWGVHALLAGRPPMSFFFPFLPTSFPPFRLLQFYVGQKNFAPENGGGGGRGWRFPAPIVSTALLTAKTVKIWELGKLLDKYQVVLAVIKHCRICISKQSWINKQTIPNEIVFGFVKLFSIFFIVKDYLRFWLLYRFKKKQTEHQII